MKQNKVCDPERTISNVRRILSKYGLLTSETFFSCSDLYYSCRVTFLEPLQGLNVGANGKGMTPAYALASAYGELMERLQNRLLAFQAVRYAVSHSSQEKLKACLAKQDIRLRFQYYPDEKVREFCRKRDFADYLSEFIPSYKECLDSDLREQAYKVLEAPYENLMTGRKELVPFELFRYAAGSTGMCAGNCYQEAVVQGINEIFERYVLQRLYLDRCTPPVIPVEEFEGTTVLERLRSLERLQGISFEVLDCSLGEGFPVIGLLLVDNKRNTCAFRLGSDLSPEIALQRCYTEIFQGVVGEKNYFSPIEFVKDPDLVAGYNRNVLDGNGRYPYELFGSVPSWQASAVVDRTSGDVGEDLEWCLDFLRKRGCVCYVRDNTFLLFDAYHVFIPGLSETDNSLFSVCRQISDVQRDNYSVPYEYRIPSLNQKEMADFLKKLEEKNQPVLTFFPWQQGMTRQVPTDLMLALGHYRIGDSEKAHFYMSRFLAQKGNACSRYYYCVRDFFFWYGRTDDCATVLRRLYGDKLAGEVMADMACPERVLDNLSLPDCFNCDSCAGRFSCRYMEVLRFECRMQGLYERHYLLGEDMR